MQSRLVAGTAYRFLRLFIGYAISVALACAKLGRFITLISVAEALLASLPLRLWWLFPSG